AGQTMVHTDLSYLVGGLVIDKDTIVLAANPYLSQRVFNDLAKANRFYLAVTAFAGGNAALKMSDGFGITLDAVEAIFGTDPEIPTAVFQQVENNIGRQGRGCSVIGHIALKPVALAIIDSEAATFAAYPYLAL